MSDNDFDLKIGADASGLEAEMQKAARVVQESLETMNGHFERLAGVMEHVNGLFLALGAALAGGAAFKEAVDSSVEMTVSANALGKSLGISASQASILNVAMESVYLSQDTVNAANERLTKTLGSNEGAFKNLGVATRDSNGNFRSSLDIMLDVNAHLLTFKEGIDRNIEGQKIYGKSWGEVQGILRLTKDAMQESAEKAKELGLIVGTENVEATAKYRAAMEESHQVIKATEKAIGDALIPVLTQLGNWFSEIGPAAVKVIKFAIDSLVAVFWELKLVGIAVIQAIGFAIELLGAGLKGLINGLMAALHGDWAGVKAAWNQGAKEVADITKFHLDKVKVAADEASEHLHALFDAQTMTKAPEGGNFSSGKDKKAKQASEMADWKNQLEQKLEADQNYFKDSLQEELAFWEQKLSLTKAGSKDRMAVEHEIYALHKKEAQQGLQDDIAEYKRQSEAAQAGGIDRVRIAGEMAQEIGAKYGLESKEYKNALMEMTKMAQEHHAEMVKIEDMRIDSEAKHAISAIDIERETLKTKKDLGEISALDEIKALQKLADDQYAIEFQASTDKAALLADGTVDQQKAYDELLVMAEKHAKEMGKINADIAAAQKAEWNKMAAPIQSAFDKSVTGMIQGTLTLQKAISNIFQSIAAEFVNLGVKMLSNWIFNEAQKTAATVLGVEQRNTAEQAGAGQSMLLNAGIAIKKIMNAAAETFAGVFSFLSSMMGPAAAGPAAASMGVVAAEAGSVMFAQQGYDIPSGVNPLVQAHQKEMILPAEQADVIRGIAGGGSSGGAVHIHTSSGDFLHKNDIAKMLKQMNRNFVFVK